MKQRSAMVAAAGLVVALALAGLGLAMGMTGPSADAKAPLKQQRPKPPIVHTVTRTITVHKPGTAPSGAATVLAAGSTAPATSVDAGGSDDPYAEEEGHVEESDEYESQEHEGDESGTTEDHGAEPGEGDDD